MSAAKHSLQLEFHPHQNREASQRISRFGSANPTACIRSRIFKAHAWNLVNHRGHDHRFHTKNSRRGRPSTSSSRTTSSSPSTSATRHFTARNAQDADLVHADFPRPQSQVPGVDPAFESHPHSSDSKSWTPEPQLDPVAGSDATDEAVADHSGKIEKIGFAILMGLTTLFLTGRRCRAGFCSMPIDPWRTLASFRIDPKVIGTGLASGCLHSLSGPDHLAALTPLTLNTTPLKALGFGASWGSGHCVGQMILALLMILCKDLFHGYVPILEMYSNYVIGFVLIAIGFVGLYETFLKTPEPEAALESPVLDLVPQAKNLKKEVAREKGRSLLPILAMGILYGLQPDSLFVILPALSLHTRIQAVCFVITFVIGTIVSMGVYTMLIGLLSTLSSVIAVGMGVYFVAF